MTKLFTIATISRELSIPESTLRYRAKMFKDFLPVEGSGRKKRFLEDAVSRFSYIDDLFNKGLSADDIRHQLEDRFEAKITPELHQKKVSRETSSVSPSSKEIDFDVKELLVPILKVIENQENIINELKRQNEMFRNSGILEAPKEEKKGFFARLFS